MIFLFQFRITLSQEGENKKKLATFLVTTNLVRSKKFYFIQTTRSRLSSLEIDVQNTMHTKLIPIIESFSYQQKLMEQGDDFLTNFQIVAKSKVLTESSVEYLRKKFERQGDLISANQIIAIRCLIEDEAKMAKLGKPVELKNLRSKGNFDSNYVAAFDIHGVNEKGALILSSKQGEIEEVFIKYHVAEKYLQTYSDHARLAVSNLLKQIELDNLDLCKLSKIFEDINLEKLIEDKLLRSTRLLNTIGKKRKLHIENEHVKQLLNGTGDAVVHIQINGNLNNADLVLCLSRKSIDEKWISSKSDVNILWKTTAE